MPYRRRTKRKSTRIPIHPPLTGNHVSPLGEPQPLHADLEANLRAVRETVGDSTDIIIRTLPIGHNDDQSIALLYTDGLADQNIITDFIMKSVMLDIDIFGQTDRTVAPPFRRRVGIEKLCLDDRRRSGFVRFRRPLSSGIVRRYGDPRRRPGPWRSV